MLLNNQHAISECLYIFFGSSGISLNKPFKLYSIHLAKLLLLCRYTMRLLRSTYSVNMMNDGMFVIHTAGAFCFSFFPFLCKQNPNIEPIFTNSVEYLCASVRIIYRRYHHRYHSFQHLSIFYFHDIDVLLFGFSYAFPSCVHLCR